MACEVVQCECFAIGGRQRGQFAAQQGGALLFLQLLVRRARWDSGVLMEHACLPFARALAALPAQEFHGGIGGHPEDPAACRAFGVHTAWCETAGMFAQQQEGFLDRIVGQRRVSTDAPRQHRDIRADGVQQQGPCDRITALGQARQRPGEWRGLRLSDGGVFLYQHDLLFGADAAKVSTNTAPG